MTDQFVMMQDARAASRPAAAIELSDLAKSFGPAKVVCGVNLVVPRGERHAVIGPNGAGKTTLFGLISGLLQPTSGDIRLNGVSITGKQAYEINRLGLSRSFQITNIFPSMSVWENIRCGVLWASGQRYSFWRSLAGDGVVAERTEKVLRDIDLFARRDALASVLTYAEQRALEIGITIAGGADVILLDEPTAGMSRQETERMVALIRRITEHRTLLIVEHDMSVIFGLADRISVLVYGEIVATGTPSEIRNDPKVQEAYLGREAS